MAVNFNPEIASIYQAQTLTQVGNTASNVADTTVKEADRDSYIPSAGVSEQAIPSGIYNAKAQMVGETEETNWSEELGASASGAGGVVSDSEESTQTEGTGAAGGSGSAGGGGSSDDSSTTETSIVTINGQTYVETKTTDSDGNVTISRTPVGSASMDDGKGGAAGPSAAAQALAAGV